MLITSASLRDLFAGFKTSFNAGFTAADATYPKIAMEVTSDGSAETYAWLGQFPRIREWLGDRIIHSLSIQDYAIANRLFEVTVSVPRTNVEDDKLGVFGPLFQNMGQETKQHPDTLVYELLSSGFTKKCYDGQPFFDPDHPVDDHDGNPKSHSNMQAGSGPAWFLLDGTKPIKPLVFQKRTSYEFQRMDGADTENVFLKDEYLYGVRARASAGFALWQLAYASKAPLTPENYEAARTAMKGVRGERGRKLGIKPSILVAPDELEGDALRLLKNETRVITAGEPPTTVTIANEWAGSAELVVSPFL